MTQPDYPSAPLLPAEGLQDVEGIQSYLGGLLGYIESLRQAIGRTSTPNDGSTGQVLTSQGPGTVPSWQTQVIPAPIPTGVILPYGATSAPTGYLLCDGAAVSRSTYAALFALIGTTYGVGNGSTTFNVPDMQGKMPVGLAAAGTFNALNNNGGTETHTIASANLPTHTHDMGNHTHGPGSFVTAIDTGGTAGGGPQAAGGAISNGSDPVTGTSGTPSTNTTGNGGFANTAVNHMNPYRVVNYIIKT